jgi:Tfp pilus assembly protein PilO
MAISLEDLKKMSPKVMALLILVAYGLIGYFYYFFFLQSALHQKAALQTKLSELQREVTEKERIASQKTRFLQEVAALKVAFQEALNKLPDKREIQPLFQTVASLGKAAGLDFLLFQPKPPEPPPHRRQRMSKTISNPPISEVQNKNLRQGRHLLRRHLNPISSMRKFPLRSRSVVVFIAPCLFLKRWQHSPALLISRIFPWGKVKMSRDTGG